MSRFKTGSPLYELDTELDRTAVISSAFKSTIIAWAMEIAREAYERGIEEGKKQSD